MTTTEIINLATEHAENVEFNIRRASTREEHIRLTQLAIEARRIVSELAATA